MVSAYNPGTDAARIRAAYAFGEEMHRGQKRRSGEPYFTHPVAVAAILTEQRLDDDTIITALLHDTVEDTRAKYSDIVTHFGPEVAEMVDGVTKLTNLQLTSSETKAAENFRKMFMAISRDIRVVLVKLADRLHNMRTIKYQSVEKQTLKSRETMDIFAPLAGRMGMQWMRDELEDLAFQVLNPEGRASILRRFVKLRNEAGDVIEKITRDMDYALKEAGINAEVYGRAKRPYSIWRKMEQKGQPFSRLADIYGFRVIANDEGDCYRALGAIHQRWAAVPGRFKDYISQPKSNGYRSIHTTVSGRDGKRVEVQIRTRQMHEVAEGGVAAHWSYRDGVRTENPFAVDPVSWITTLTETLESAENDEFLEHVKLEMYSDQVFCFTPKGEVVKLPRGGTPIDFAYGIHTRIGDRCVGAKVDGMRVPLWTRLRNGQSVSIITAEGQRPQSTWLDIAVTGRARQAIRKSLRAEDRARFVKLGRELARVAFEQVGKKMTDKALNMAASTMGIGDVNELLAKVGAAELPARDVVALIYPELAKHNAAEEVARDRAVLGLEQDQTSKRGRCCMPVPGERIVGITYRGKGVVVHAIDCPVLMELEDQPERWVDLRWHSGPHAAVYGVSLEITIANDSGVLGRICTLIGEQKANISDLTFVDRKPDFYRLLVDIDLRDVEHLHQVMTALQAESDVAEVKRVRNSEYRP